MSRLKMISWKQIYISSIWGLFRCPSFGARLSMVQAFRQVSTSPSCYQSYFFLNAEWSYLRSSFSFKLINGLSKYFFEIAQINVHEKVPRRTQGKSINSIYVKKYLKKKKEEMLKNTVEEKCDHCDYKTANHLYMIEHKRINHSDTKQHCSACDYSHVYPNRVRQHFKQVHLGIKRYMHRTMTCRRKWCEHFGKTNCTELTNHSLYVCEQCQLTFDRVETLKYHNEKIHEGVVYNCEFCKEYSNPRKYNLARHILRNHSKIKS